MANATLPLALIQIFFRHIFNNFRERKVFKLFFSGIGKYFVQFTALIQYCSIMADAKQAAAPRHLNTDQKCSTSVKKPLTKYRGSI